jgi:hypothetical protein
MRTIAKSPAAPAARLTSVIDAAILTRVSTAVAVAALAGAAALAVVAAPLHAQSLADRVSSIDDGSAQLRFASRPGVCGDGRGSIGTDGHTVMRRYSSDDRYDENWCTPGPVRVVLTVHEGSVRRARVFVGGNDSSSGVRDLGTVGAREATDYFLALAKRAGSGVGDDAVLAVVLADSVTPWPGLFSIARDASIARGTRESATFWLSRAAAAAVNHRALFAGRDEAESESDEVRNAAIFALSQQPHDEGVPALIRVARGNSSPTARDRALFWLGQSGDPRALDLFAELLAVR